MKLSHLSLNIKSLQNGKKKELGTFLLSCISVLKCPESKQTVNLNREALHMTIPSYM